MKDQLTLEKHSWLFLLSALLIFFAVVAIRNAWICDDTFITMRSVDHFVNGFGLRYNVTERVQIFTHPLWFFLLAVCYYITGNVYFTIILLCFGVSLIAVWMVPAKLASNPVSGLVAIIILILSKAFVDFSSSGLENPLTHLLLAVFCYFWFASKPPKHHLFYLSLIACLAVCNRMDSLLLFLPALGVLVWQNRNRQALLSMGIAWVPFIFWEVFSLFYFGLLFPNTAYAKLNTGISSGALAEQGVLYVLNSLTLDPITGFAIGLAALMVFFSRDKSCIPLAAGMILYCMYVVRIGGDFMSGRFFSAPLFLATIILSRQSFPSAVVVGWMALAGVLGLASPYAPLRSSVDYQSKEKVPTGIVDERGFYYRGTGLLGAHRSRYVTHWQPLPADEGKGLSVASSIGFTKMKLGPKVHVLDYLALADPLLARLPTYRQADWRIGHFHRKIPEGYPETLRTGKNVIRDPNLALYYDKLTLIVKEPLFAKGRFSAIFGMLLGRYDHLIDKPFYQKIESQEMDLAQVSNPNGVARLIPMGNGLRINLENRSTAETLKLTGRGKLDVYFYQNDKPLLFFDNQFQPTFSQRITATGTEMTMTVPAEVAKLGFDAFVFFAVHNEQAEDGYLQRLTLP